MFAASGNPNDTSDQTLLNLAFYPDIVVADFRGVIRAQDSVTDERVIWALQNAMIEVNDELEAWRYTKELDGFLNITEIPANIYGVISELVLLYNTAVYSKAKALLLEYYTDADNTPDGDDRAVAFEHTVDVYLREAKEALRKILGVPRITVELI